MPGIADARLLPDDRFSDAWSSIVLPAGLKERLVRGAASRAMLRAAVPFETMPLHGVVLLTGLPGVGKTTLARGLADKVARTVQGVGQLGVHRGGPSPAGQFVARAGASAPSSSSSGPSWTDLPMPVRLSCCSTRSRRCSPIGPP